MGETIGVSQNGSKNIMIAIITVLISGVLVLFTLVSYFWKDENQRDKVRFWIGNYGIYRLLLNTIFICVIIYIVFHIRSDIYILVRKFNMNSTALVQKIQSSNILTSDKSWLKGPLVNFLKAIGDNLHKLGNTT